MRTFIFDFFGPQVGDGGGDDDDDDDDGGGGGFASAADDAPAIPMMPPVAGV